MRVADLAVQEDRWLGGHLGKAAYHLPVEPASSAEQLQAMLAPLRGARFVDAKVPTTDVASVGALEDCGFRVVDVNVTMEVPRLVVDHAPAGVGLAGADDEAEVGRIAASALTQSRFHLDPAIRPSVASAIKEAWARNFFVGARGDWMVVGRSGAAIDGFAQLLDRPDALVIDLIAVSPTRQGAGIGRALIEHACHACGDAPLVRVGTQAANTRSLRFYESLGFKVVSTAFVLHQHLDG